MLSNARHCASKGDVEGSWDITLQTLCNMRQKSKCLTRSLLTPNEAITWLWQQWSKINVASTVHCLWASNPPYLSLFSLWVIYFIRHGAFLQSKKKKKKKKESVDWSELASVILWPCCQQSSRKWVWDAALADETSVEVLRVSSAIQMRSHTRQCTDDASQNCTLATHIILLTVTP